MQIKYIIKDHHLQESSQDIIHPRENFVDAVKGDTLKQCFGLTLFLKFSFFEEEKHYI